MLVMIMAMFFLVVFDSSDEKKAEIAKRQEWVGKSIELHGDTLEIVRYHILHKEYILEDGHRASPEMVAILLIRN